MYNNKKSKNYKFNLLDSDIKSIKSGIAISLNNTIYPDKKKSKKMMKFQQFYINNQNYVIKGSNTLNNSKSRKNKLIK